jgi:hypothetical protein
MIEMTPADHAALSDAVEKLETQSFAMTVASKAGVPVKALLRLVPTGAQASLHDAINKALEQCLRIALRVGHSAALPRPPAANSTPLLLELPEPSAASSVSPVLPLSVRERRHLSFLRGARLWWCLGWVRSMASVRGAMRGRPVHA